MKSGKLIGLGINAAKSNLTELKRPYKMTFAITYRCQSRCLTCNIWQRKPVNELTTDEIREFAKKNNYFRWLEITGGEPFLNSDIVEIVKAFVQNSDGLFILTMPTNSLCNQEMLVGKLKQILDLGIPKVSITLSLDGNRELHDRIRGIPGNFDRVMSMARRLKELQKEYKNLFFVFGYTMSRLNQGHLEETINDVRKELPWATANNFHVNVGQLSGMYYGNEDMQIAADRESVAKEVKMLLKMRKKEIGIIPIIEGIFLRKLVDYVTTGKSPMRSRSMDVSLFLDSYGNVFPSIMWDKKIGNIRDTGYDLGKIWSSQEADEIRKSIKEGKEPDSWTACEAYQTIVGDIKEAVI
jgi:MoaA/NifB/PqqE/SkfB family radical SAM enzyme